MIEVSITNRRQEHQFRKDDTLKLSIDKNLQIFLQVKETVILNFLMESSPHFLPYLV